jgi:hypothetical protein
MQQNFDTNRILGLYSNREEAAPADSRQTCAALNRCRY